MTTRPLTVQIPEPDKDGSCSVHCQLLFPLNPGEYDCGDGYGRVHSGVRDLKPGPGCPWYPGAASTLSTEAGIASSVPAKPSGDASAASGSHLHRFCNGTSAS
jgi:hypothetical protein